MLLYLVAHNGSVENIRKTFAHTTVVYRAGAAFYGLGSLFGFVAALNGSIDLTTPWLMAANGDRAADRPMCVGVTMAEWGGTRDPGLPRSLALVVMTSCR